MLQHWVCVSASDSETGTIFLHFSEHTKLFCTATYAYDIKKNMPCLEPIGEVSSS